jgi:type IV secretory pathway TrbF-like protein
MNIFKKISDYFIRLSRYFFSKDDEQLDKQLRIQQKEVITEAMKNKDNPYLFGYATYIALYADQEEKSTYYKNINRILLMLVIFFAFMFAIVSFSSDKIPFVVGVTQNGQVFDMNESVNNITIKQLIPKMQKWYMGEFIKSVFSISIDGDVLRDNQSRAYSMVRGSAYNTLHTFYNQRKSKKIAEHNVISIDVHHVLLISKHTFKVDWTETTKDAKSAQVLNVQKYEGQFTFGWDKHAKETLISKFNPLGFYITSMTWSQDMVTG